MTNTGSRVIAYKDAATEALLQAMEKDLFVFLMGEGVDNITGVYGHVLPAYKKFGSKRVIDTPLSENALTGFAIGAALDGMRPVLIHQRNDFMLLTMDQMMNQAAKLRYTSGGKHRVPITILSFVAKKSGEGAQHSQSLQSIFSHFPGIKVGMPFSPVDVKGMILSAIFDDNPVIILEHRSLFENKGFVPEEYYKTSFTANFVTFGSDITVVAVSLAVKNTLEAQKELITKGISLEIIDLRWLRPLDINPIVRSVRKTGRLLVVDTGWKMFGVSSEIIAQVCEKAFSYLKFPPRRITLPDAPCPASQFLEPYYHPSTEDVVKTVLEMF